MSKIETIHKECDSNSSICGHLHFNKNFLTSPAHLPILSCTMSSINIISFKARQIFKIQKRMVRLFSSLKSRQRSKNVPKALKSRYDLANLSSSIKVLDS